LCKTTQGHNKQWFKELAMDDKDYWHTTNPNDLWLFDKLILSKKLGYVCGPAGVAPPAEAVYVVRPCVNYRMMSRGAELMTLGPNQHDAVPDGYFWCEVFQGRHLSFDYHFGRQVLSVEGFRDDAARLDRFSRWQRTADCFELPQLLADIAERYEWMNVEVIGNRVIEVHLRYNDDFSNHTADTIIPVWRDQFYASAAGDRLGFILK
jgi:hypothetical protein